MSDTNKYAEELMIDPEMLDVEWLKQPQYFFKYSEKYAESQMEYSRAKENLNVVRAEVYSEIVEQAIAKGDKKPTEAMIESQILLHPKYKESSENLRQISFESDILQSAVRAFEQRKTALENLVKLHGASYFSSPSAPRELKKTMGEIEREGVNRQIRRRLNSSE